MKASILLGILVFDICLLFMYLEMKTIRRMLETIADLIAYDYADEKDLEKEIEDKH